jgi:hypothetical protein
MAGKSGSLSTTQTIPVVEIWVLYQGHRWIERLPQSTYQARLRELLELEAVICWVTHPD